MHVGCHHANPLSKGCALELALGEPALGRTCGENPSCWSPCLPPQVTSAAVDVLVRLLPLVQLVLMQELYFKVLGGSGGLC